MSKKIVYIIIAQIIGILTIFAQTRTGGILAGRVLANNGTPQGYVNIYLSFPSLWTNSDSLGYFVISDIPKGSYTLNIQQMFYHYVTINNLKFIANDSVFKEIRLEPTDTIINPDYSLYLNSKEKAIYLADSLCAKELFLFITLNKDSTLQSIPCEFVECPYVIIKYDPLSNSKFRELYNERVFASYKKRWEKTEAIDLKRRVGF